MAKNNSESGRIFYDYDDAVCSDSTTFYIFDSGICGVEVLMSEMICL